MSASDNAREQAAIAAAAAADKHAEDIVAVDVSSHLALSDVFLVCTGKTARQVQAIVDHIMDSLQDAGTKPLHREGETLGEWVLLDYPEIVVHVQQPHTRETYRLERLWGDCPQLSLSAANAAQVTP